MARKEKRVTVYLFGGLGNQLFQYFAGLAIAESTGASLYLKPFGSTSAKGQEGEVGLGAFRVEGTQILSRIPSGLQEKLLRRFVNLLNHSGLRRFAEKRGIFLSDKVDLQSMNGHRRIHLIGYFQDSKYLNFLMDKGRDIHLSLKDPSVWFQNLEVLARVKKPVIVHIRRGDYINHADSIGVLDFEYFLNALHLVTNFWDSNSEVWIFSDSLPVAREFASYAGLPESRVQIIQPPQESPAAESLLLMSSGSALIISNSTFSWWSAYLMKYEGQIVAPQKWFKALVDPENIKLTAWLSSESIWE